MCVWEIARDSRFDLAGFQGKVEDLLRVASERVMEDFELGCEVRAQLNSVQEPRSG